MKLNNNLIIGAALLGGGAYYAYTKGWFGKKKETPSKAIKQNQENWIELRLNRLLLPLPLLLLL
jgi:hypothetical protein